MATVIAWLLLPTIGYTDGSYPEGVYSSGWVVADHALYMFFHASVWHLTGNLFVLWMLRGKLYLVEAFTTAFLMSWLPAVPGVWNMSAAPLCTVGLSGVIFAIIGIKWGVFCVHRTRGYRTFALKVVPFILLGAVVPNVNWSLHLYCLLMGLFVGVVQSLHKKRSYQV